MRTPRGRTATRRAWLHFGIKQPKHLQTNEDAE